MLNKIPLFILHVIYGSIACGQTPLNDPHWQLVWEDNFNSFSSSKWVKAHHCDHGNEPQLYLSDNVWTDGGQLFIMVNNIAELCNPAEHSPEFAWCECNPVVHNYTSGWIESKEEFDTQYGFIEARIKLPYGKGFWPAFWTWEGHSGASNSAEIDVFEMLGSKPNSVMGTNIHKSYCSPCAPNCSGLGHYAQKCPSCDPLIQCYGQDVSPTGFTYANTWHKYAIEWTPSKIIWYIDDRSVRMFPNPRIVDPIRIILNLAIEGSNLPDQTTPFPSYMNVDYVRVYTPTNDCSTLLNVCNYSFGTHDNRVKKKITIGDGSCSNALITGQNVFLRASEGVLLMGDFYVPIGAQIYIDANPCY